MMKEPTLAEVALQTFEQRLEKALEGKNVACVHTCGDVFLHVTREGDVAKQTDRFSIGSGEISLHSIKRALEVNEGVSSVFNAMINSMVVTVVHHVEATDEGNGVTIYFSPQDPEKEKFAKKLYADLYLCEDEEGRKFPALAVESFFSVLPVGSNKE